MHVESAEMPPEQAPDAPRKRGQSAPIVGRIDRRTRTSRRIRETTAIIIAAMGSEAALTPLQHADLERASELTVLAEDARAAALRGSGAFDSAAIVKLENLADRAVRRLRLPAKPSTTERDHFAELAALAGEADGDPREATDTSPDAALAETPADPEARTGEPVASPEGAAA